jgi:tetratricopeptide (TPR) repeat protein
VKKQQLIVVGGGFLLLITLFFFGTTVSPERKQKAQQPAAHDDHAESLDFQDLLKHAKERLTPQQLQQLISLENSVSRGDVKTQKLLATKALAAFWGDTARIFEPYAFYTAEAAKLENSEKSLTFAAHLFLNSMRGEDNPAVVNWMATNAKDLFEKALAINPANDSSKIGLGACYLFGHISDNPMEGILKIRAVADKDSTNTYAQMMLGLGGMKSGQFDKAIDRFLKVMAVEPTSLEAAINLAEAYDQLSNKTKAVEWYKFVKDKVTNPQAKKAIEDRIKALQ